ncbi:1-acyl-sn-glycerol-3-phosphate acyltransferase [Bizionia sediminis]|uniref:1-acyl-sn-glycerol-3-phosphate acyltransferase n=1 Tax=Bizionia sediminis TaxID=1737064 RepID=A0ABW5KNU8_9FLAO
MKKVWLYSVRAYIKLGLFFYYKRVRVAFKTPLSSNEAILFVANHNNALMDALLIAVHSGRFSYFLTRASVFQKPMIRAILSSLNMLPVYRVRDGWTTITNNKQVFFECSKILGRGDTVVIFPEGNHHINRTVRPVSKGFTRVVWETLKHNPNCNLKIVPIGLNYEQATDCANSVFINFGTAIKAQAYTAENITNATKLLKTDVWHALSRLTTHIPAAQYQQTATKLQALGANFLYPSAVNSCMASNFEKCHFPYQAKSPLLLKRLFKFLMILLLLGPYMIWKLLVSPRIKDAAFKATFRFAIAIGLVPIWLALVAIFLMLTFSGGIAVMYLVAVIIASMLAIKL